MSRSPLGKIELKRSSMNELLMLDSNDYKELNTSSVNAHLPIFEYKLGPNMPLRFDLSF